MIEVRAREAEGAAIACENDRRSPAKILATVVAPRVPVGNEDAQVAGGVRAGGRFRGHGSPRRLGAQACG